MAKKSYVIQENGQVTLPQAFRKKYNLKKGDMVVFKETRNGLLIDAKETLALNLLEEIEAILEEKGVTLDEVIASGQETRQQLYNERYARDNEQPGDFT